MGLGVTELLIILGVALLFFGPSRLPQLGQSIGKAIRGFKSGLNEIEIEAKDVTDNKKEQLASQKEKQTDSQS